MLCVDLLNKTIEIPTFEELQARNKNIESVILNSKPENNVVPLEEASKRAIRYKDIKDKLSNIEVASIAKMISDLNFEYKEDKEKIELLEDEIAKVSTNNSNYDIDILKYKDKLRNIRREQAEKENVPPYVIFSDATLMELATYLPQTKEELNEISGFGTFKIEKYGELFLSVIVEFCEQNNLSSLIFNKKPKKKREPKTVNKSPAGTFTTSYQMFKAGNSIEEIANIRNLAINTIQNHLVNFVTVGTIKPSELMNTNKIEPILEIAKSQSIISLKAIKEELGEDYSYFEIHIAIAYYKSQH